MRVFKNSVFVVVLVSAAWIVARAECAVPIVNYSFENSAIGSAPSGWYGYSGGTADGTVASVSGLTGATGSQCLSIAGTGPSDQYVTQILSTTITAGVSYELRMDVAVGSSTVTLEPDWYDGADIEVVLYASDPSDPYGNLHQGSTMGGNWWYFGDTSAPSFPMSGGGFPLKDTFYSVTTGAWEDDADAGMNLMVVAHVKWTNGEHGNVFIDNVQLGAVATSPQDPGDANQDGRVDINDLTIVLTNYGKGGFWTDGDFNGDGKVDVNDLTIVLSNFGKTAGAGLADVPEPSSVMLLAIGAFALLLVRRKRRA